MQLLVLATLLVGTVLGVGFSVWILIPAAIVTLAVAATHAVFVDAGLSSFAVNFVTLSVALQTAYFAGSVVYRSLFDRAPDAPRRLKQQGALK